LTDAGVPVTNEVQTESAPPLNLVHVVGEVDLSWSQDVRASILKILGEGKPVAVVMNRVSYIDSSGIAALVEGLQTAKQRGVRFALVSPSSAVRAVLELARLDRVFTLLDSLEQARAELA
jgi:anti-sigma B factor antagonist